MTIEMTVDATPYRFPLAGSLEAHDTALMIIDMQVDFCAPGGFLDRMGVDLAPLRAPIAPISRVLAAMRRRGFTIVHTRETFASDLADVQPHRRFRGVDGTVIIPGDPGPLGRSLIRGEPCWEIIPELAPGDGEGIFDKNGYSAFNTTDVHDHLQAHGIANLVLCGVTTNCCIQSNLRGALDRGYDCLVLEDCCGAASAASHRRAIAMMRSDDGIFGAQADAAALIAAVSGPP